MVRGRMFPRADAKQTPRRGSEVRRNHSTFGGVCLKSSIGHAIGKREAVFDRRRSLPDPAVSNKFQWTGGSASYFPLTAYPLQSTQIRSHRALYVEICCYFR